jgi:hypothetical protein
MIICINVERNTKDQLDQLIRAGQYRDYSELAAIAIGNQLLLHGTAENELVQHSGPISSNDSPRKAVIAPSGESKSDLVEDEATQPKHSEAMGIPEIFQLAAGRNGPDTFAPLPNDAFAPGMEVPVDRWIFGQHNKLLPVKANLRALGVCRG